MELKDLQNITIKVSILPNDVNKILGTGFFINLEGHILTCYHVVFDNDKKIISPLFFNSSWVDESNIVFADKDKDIAIFKLKNFTPEISEKIPVNLNFSPSVNSKGYSYGYGDAVDNKGNSRQYVYEFRDYVQLPNIQVFKAENTSTAKVDFGDSGSLAYSDEYEAIIGVNFRKKHRMQTLKKSGFDVFQSEVYTIPFSEFANVFKEKNIPIFEFEHKEQKDNNNGGNTLINKGNGGIFLQGVNAQNITINPDNKPSKSPILDYYDLISKNKIGEVLDSLYKKYPNDNSIVLLKARYSSLNEQIINGILSPNDTEWNKLAYSVKKLVDKLTN